MSTFYLSLLGIYFVALALVMLLGNWRHRAAAIVLAQFTFGLNVDIGLQIEPTKVVALASAGLLVIVTLDRFFWKVAWSFLLFGVWMLLVWAAGYWVLERDLGNSWARGSNGKPLVQLCSFLIIVAQIPVVYRALRTPADVSWLLTFWAKVAGVSAGLCHFQVAYFVVTGAPLWGIFRSQGQLAVASVGGVLVQRANALGGEPKQQGMLMAVSLVLLISSWRRSVLQINSRLQGLLIVLVGGATLLTFSSGAYLTLGLYFATCLWRSSHANSRQFAVLFGGAAIVMLLFRPGVVLEVYESRVVRVYEQLHSMVVQSKSTHAIAGVTDDKEVPAVAFMVQNPRLAITGVGLGAGPFYFNDLVEDRYVGEFNEQNSGLSWAVYAFGLIGIGLFAVPAITILRGGFANGPVKGVLRELNLVIVLSFLPLHMLALMSLALAVSIAPGVRRFGVPMDSAPLAKEYRGPAIKRMAAAL